MLGAEPVIWFQGVQWWPATVSPPKHDAVDAADPGDGGEDIFGGSILGFSTADEAPSGRPDSGVVAVTSTRLLLLGEWTRSSWPLGAVARFAFHPARFVQSTAAHFELRTPAGLHRLLPGRGASPEPLLTDVAEARARLRAAPPAPPSAPPPAPPSGLPGGPAGEPSTAALLGQLSELRDRGTITQAQFEAERIRLLN